MHRPLALVLALSAVVAAPVLADEEERSYLTIGDAAPPLVIAHWIKGVEMDRRGNFDPVTEFEAGMVYVLDFWATWCGPCKMTMPLVSELQERYEGQGVRVIGISDETLPKVYEFLWQRDRDGEVQNDRARYTLTTDPDKSTHRDYMDAAGLNGIPTVFVVGKGGRIEWIGHPAGLADVLAAVVDDEWDRDAFKTEYEAAQKLERAVIAARPRLAQAARSEDWDTVLAVFDELLELAPDNPGLRAQKLNVLLMHVDDREKTYAYAEAFAKDIWDDAQALNALAWTIADNANVKHRDFDFALKIAQRANELTESEDAAILDTVARVHFEKGDLETALAWQTKAVEAAGEGELADDLERTLERYREAREEAKDKEEGDEEDEGDDDEE